MPTRPTADLPPLATTQIAPVAALAAVAVDKGISLDRIMATTGLTMTELVQPEARVPDPVLGSLWHLLIDAFDGQGIGLQVARDLPLTFFGALSAVVQRAATLREMLEVSVRYATVLSSGIHLELHHDPAYTQVTMRHPLDVHVPLDAPPEAVLGVWVRHLHELGLGDAVARVEFVHQPTTADAHYVEVFGDREVCFGRPSNALVLHTRALGRPSPHADRCAFGRLSGQLEAQRQRLTGGTAPSERQRILEAIDHNARRGEFGAEALARRLGTSLRSLERQARADDLSIRSLLDEARERRARVLLLDSRLGIEQVADRVGYSAESAFRRAFKRWSGMSPAQFRRQGVSAAPAMC